MLSVQNLTDNRLLLGVPGDFDAVFASEARSRFEEIAETWSGDVTVDFMQSHFLDSSGIGAIVFLYKRLAAKGHGLEIVNIDGQPLDVIRSLRIDRVIPVRIAGAKVAS